MAKVDIAKQLEISLIDLTAIYGIMPESEFNKSLGEILNNLTALVNDVKKTKV